MRLVYTEHAGGCRGSPGVDDWLLQEEEFAELEPRDLRGAEAATAANKNQTDVWMCNKTATSDMKQWLIQRGDTDCTVWRRGQFDLTSQKETELN